MVVLATFVLLFLLTGSVLVPVKALVLVVVSLGASLGVLVWGFQQGRLEGVMSFDSTGGIETLIPVLIVALGFGLSMDYEVFLLARIKELRDAGLPTTRRWPQGLQRSGRIITSAALVIVVVFLGSPPVNWSSSRRPASGWRSRSPSMRRSSGWSWCPPR